MLEKKETNRIKKYGIVMGITTLVLQHAIYLLSNEIAKLVGGTPLLPKIAYIDDVIPLIPLFILPYLWSYFYWGMTPMVVSKCDRDHFWDYIASYMFACLFGALILIFVPTYMDRQAEGLMDIPKSGLFYSLMHFVYSMDGEEIAYNLCPSFHCINSTISYLGVCRRKEIPRWYRSYSLIITVIIYFSTLFVKQHYFMDVISGITIALISFFVCKKWHAGRIFNRPEIFCRKLVGKIKIHAGKSTF